MNPIFQSYSGRKFIIFFSFLCQSPVPSTQRMGGELTSLYTASGCDSLVTSAHQIGHVSWAQPIWSTQSFSQVIGSKDLSVMDQYLDDGIRVQSDELGGDILLEWSIIVWRHLGCVVFCLVRAWVWDPLSLQTMSYFKFHEQKTGPVSCLWPGTSKVQVYLTISKSSTRTLVFIHCRLHTCKVCMFLLRNVLPWVDNCCLCVVGNDLFSSLTV